MQRTHNTIVDQLPIVVAVQALLIGFAGTIFPPVLAAITLGIIGHGKLDKRLGGNEPYLNLFEPNYSNAWLVNLTKRFLQLRHCRTFHKKVFLSIAVGRDQKDKKAAITTDKILLGK